MSEDRVQQQAKLDLAIQSAADAQFKLNELRNRALASGADVDSRVADVKEELRYWEAAVVSLESSLGIDKSGLVL